MKSAFAFSQIALAGLAAATLSVLTACGGGGGAEGSASAPPTAAPPAPAAPVAEAPKPLKVSGTVTGFGSVIIDGIKYDDSVAAVAVDNGGSQGSPVPLGDLKLGMTVDATVDSGKLTQVTVRAAMFGPVESVDTLSSTFRIYGQTVKVVISGATPTLFEGVGGLSSLAANDRVEVHGILDSNRVVVATRVERKPVNPGDVSVRLGGAVTALDATAKTFKLNELTVDYASTSVTPAGQVLSNGQEVVVFGAAAPSAGRMMAQTLRIRAADEGAPLIVGGRVSGLTSLSSFSVGGQRINAGSALVEGGTSADVVDGQAIAAEGTVVSGVLRAQKLRIIKTSVDVLASLKGDVSGFVSAGNFKLRGASVDASRASFVGGVKEELGNGSYVQIQGTVRGDVFLGDKVEFLKHAASQPVKIAGELREWNATGQSFKVLGHSARLASSTLVEGGGVPDLANGRRVSLEGQSDANGVVLVSKLILQPEVVTQTVTVLSGRAYDVTPSSFRLPGLIVTHSSSTVFESGSYSDLVNGATVYVKGRLNSSKQGLFATWVDVVKADSTAARVLGTVSDFSSRSDFRVAGQRIDASGAELVDGSAGALVDGVQVMATGALVERAGRQVFVATKLRFMQ